MKIECLKNKDIKSYIDYLYLTLSKKKVGTKDFYHKMGVVEKDTTVYIKNILG